MSCALPPPDNQTDSLWHRLRQTPMRDILRGCMTARLDWETSLGRSGLPIPAQKIVAQVVKRTKLWRLEKTEVCNELVAHFGDGIAAGETTEELLKNFGDIRQTAQLIRRAKKRQRPLLWHGVKWVGRSVAALMVLYAGLTVWYSTDKVMIKVDYLAQLNAATLATPESERAWPIYRDTLMGWPALMEEPKYEEVNEESRPVNFSAVVEEVGRPSPPAPAKIKPGTPAWEMMVRKLDAHQKDIAAFRSAAARPCFGVMVGLGFQKEDIPFFYHGEYAKYAPAPCREYLVNVSLSPQEAEKNTTMGVILPHLGKIKSAVACVLAADLERAAAHGDSATIYADAQALFGLARQMDHEGAVLIEQLVGYSIHQMALVHLEQAITRHPGLFDDAKLRQVAALIRQCPVPRLHLDGERIWSRDMIQSTYTDDGYGDGHFAGKLNSMFILGGGPIGGVKTSPWRKWLASSMVQPVFTLLAAPRREAAAKADAYLDQLEAEALVPLWKMPTSRAQEDMLHEFRSPYAWNRLRFPLAAVCFPSLGSVRATPARLQATHAALELGIALHRHQLAAGSFPKDLSALVPAYLQELPVDPITGGPLHYRLDDKGQPIVYSVGGDRKDDGGYAPVNKAGEDDTWRTQRWADCEVKGDWILWPMHGRPLMKKAK